MKHLLTLLLLTITVTAQDITANLYTYKAKVTDVYDGDTMTADIDLGLQIYTIKKLRLFGIDTPELKGDERPQGLVVRDYVRGLILNKEVILKTHKDKSGKYGRLLSTLYYLDGDKWVNLNDMLLGKGLAKEYQE